MLFSLLIANFNNGHFFNDCYQSILAQTFDNWEVIIVDDGSTDDSVDIIKYIIGEDERFKLYHNPENRGCGYTKNRCASLANGQVMGFLDPDDALTEGALKLMIEKHKESEDVAIITSNYELVDLDMKVISRGTHGSDIPKDKSYLTYAKGALTHFASFKQKNYKKSIGIDPIMKRAVDQDLYFKMEEQGEHKYINKVLYKYRIHQGSISNNENLFKAQYWHFYAMEKAYKRRKQSKQNLDNFSRKHFNELRARYYMERFNRIKHTHKYCAKYYFLLKVNIAFPGYKWKSNLKSLFLSIPKKS